MKTSQNEDLLRYYMDELSRLRETGGEFADSYPRVAARLRLGRDECADPHVERLLESFAFLTARLRQDLDGQLPEITTALLGVLYPHLVNPVPPMAVARFDADPAQGKLTEGFPVKRHTALFATTAEGHRCRFRTCYPVTLWPLEVTEARLEDTAHYSFLDAKTRVMAVLRVRLSCTSGTLADLSLRRLRFYLDGEPVLTGALYELLFCHAVKVALLPEGSQEPVYLPPDSILPVGFDEEEEVLPHPPTAHPAYRLLQEYFAFPEKFHFFDLDMRVTSLGADDITDLAGLAAKLRDGRDAFSARLRDRLSADTLRLLEAAEPDAPPDESLRGALVAELNRLLAGSPLFGRQRFTQLELSEEERELLAQNLRGEKLARLNRLLLEAAYPQEIARSGGRGRGKSLDILFMLDEAPADNLTVGARNFALGCTPIINLFQKTTEPIRLDHRSVEYRLVPDKRRERTTEIHSVLSVSSASADDGQGRRFEPFYSYNHAMDGAEHKAFWHARRRPSVNRDRPGTEVYLSFHDLDFNPARPPAQTVYARTLCTNRELATQVPAGAELQVEEQTHSFGIVCLTKPTFPAQPPLQGETIWRLVSHLSLNHLSLAGGHEGLAALQEILKLYSSHDRPATRQQIAGVVGLECKKIVCRVGADAWRGFCRGTEITVEFDEDMYVGGGAFLLGAVLNKFFALYASVNSATLLRIKRRRREGVWKEWPPTAGARMAL